MQKHVHKNDAKVCDQAIFSGVLGSVKRGVPKKGKGGGGGKFKRGGMSGVVHTVVTICLDNHFCESIFKRISACGGLCAFKKKLPAVGYSLLSTSAFLKIFRLC